MKHTPDDGRVRTPEGNRFSCKGWFQEAAQRVLRDNLHEAVSGNPYGLAA